jgi:hypothetical protein
LSGWLAYFDVKLPELLAAGFMLAAWLLFRRTERR